MGSIKSFTDLIVWKRGHSLVIKIYKLTGNFPKEEIYGITNQLRRCALSVTSNIAEGFGRISKKEKVQFYSITHGSLTELQNQLLVSRDIGYIKETEFKILADLAIEVQKLLRSLMNKTKSGLYYK